MAVVDKLLESALLKLPGTYFNLVNCCVYLPCYVKMRQHDCTNPDRAEGGNTESLSDGIVS